MTVRHNEEEYVGFPDMQIKSNKIANMQFDRAFKWMITWINQIAMLNKVPQILPQYNLLKEPRPTVKGEAEHIWNKVVNINRLVYKFWNNGDLSEEQWKKLDDFDDHYFSSRLQYPDIFVDIHNRKSKEIPKIEPQQEMEIETETVSVTPKPRKRNTYLVQMTNGELKMKIADIEVRDTIDEVREGLASGQPFYTTSKHTVLDEFEKQ